VLVLGPASAPLAAVAPGGEMAGVAAEVQAALAHHGLRPRR
jgi:hypothetical protein